MATETVDAKGLNCPVPVLRAKKALKKLSADNLSNLTPHPFHVALNYSHPTVLQRIEALAALPVSRGQG